MESHCQCLARKWDLGALISCDVFHSRNHIQSVLWITMQLSLWLRFTKEVMLLTVSRVWWCRHKDEFKMGFSSFNVDAHYFTHTAVWWKLQKNEQTIHVTHNNTLQHTYIAYRKPLTIVQTKRPITNLTVPQVAWPQTGTSSPVASDACFVIYLREYNGYEFDSATAATWLTKTEIVILKYYGFTNIDRHLQDCAALSKYLVPLDPGPIGWPGRWCYWNKSVIHCINDQN